MTAYAGLDFAALFARMPSLYLVIAPDLTIAAATDAHCRATNTVREGILGRYLFDVFPQNPDEPNAGSESSLKASLERVLQTGRPDAMAVLKYDVVRPAEEGGGFDERYWSILNTPIHDDAGKVVWILNSVDDVTHIVRLRAEGAARDSFAREQQSLIDQLRATNEELARQVEENARLEVARRQEAQAKRAAEFSKHQLELAVAETTRNLEGANEEMRRSAEILMRTIESVAEPMLVADGSGDIIMANAAAQELFGERGKILDLSKAYHLFNADGVTPLANSDGPLSRALRGKTVEGFEFIRRPLSGGKDTHFIAGSRPIRDPSGRLTGAVAVYRDVTQMRATELQLRQAQKMEAVGQLTGGIAHDFNNILTVIIGLTAVLADELANRPELAETTGMVLEAAERGAQMVGNLLAFARKQPLEPAAIDVNDLVGKASKLLQPTLGEQVEIAIALTRDAWPALVDPSQLTNAVFNLAINARDAMPEGGKLTMETANVTLDANYTAAHEDVEPGRYVMVAISDTGSGIPAAHLTRVFDPFFTTKKSGSGSGLGLSMVYGFVKQSGGHIKIYSEEGYGTTIKMYLPRAEEVAARGALEPAAKQVPGGHETIVVVEDDALVRSYVAAQLKTLGYNIVAFGTAADALAYVNSGRGFDLLFTDVILAGGLNGRELAERVMEDRPETKVLYTSGYAENAMLHQGRLDPGVHLLPKPYQKADLARAVRAALDGFPRREHITRRSVAR
jgi:PAS domain S-box-containing protein